MRPRLSHTIILLIVAILIFALVTQGYGMDQKQPSANTLSECSLVLKNTSGSTILLSNKQPTNKKEFSKKELESLDAIAIAPHNSEEINLGRWFSIYTRIPQTNDTFQLHYTIAYRSCAATSLPIVLTTSQIEADQLERSRLVAIDHLHGDISEGNNRLCPNSKKPVWDKNEEQWFCRLRRRTGQSNNYHYEYVPVQTYIYKYLPDWLIGTWYTKNPTYYNWYHAKPVFWQHMSNYKAPWQTVWYKEWYEQASEKEKKYLHEPPLSQELEGQADQTPTNYTPNKNRAYGLPENKVNISSQETC